MALFNQDVDSLDADPPCRLSSRYTLGVSSQCFLTRTYRYCCSFMCWFTSCESGLALNL